VFDLKVSIDEEKEEEAFDFFLMLLSPLLKEAPFQRNKCTLDFKGKNILIFFTFR
jgi:hypothetical protein